MNFFMRSSSIALGALLCASASFAQMAISASSGMVHYTEGDVTLGQEPIDLKFGHFPSVKEGQTLTTKEGRAELLLTPGVFLRVAENSSVKMISTRLIDTRVELLSGSVLVECAEIQKDTALTFVYKDTTLEFHKAGLVRLDASDDMVRVYNGEVGVIKAGQTLTLKEGKQTLVSGVLSPEKFDNKVGDAFYRWASRRAAPLAMANVAAAKSIRDSGQNWMLGNWFYNPMMGAYTYIPGRGYYNSPFGYSFYSPQYVGRIYEVPQVSNSYNPGFDSSSQTGSYNSSNLGYNTVSRSGAVQSSAPSYSGPGNAAAAAPAPAPARTGDTGGGQNSGGRGR